MVEWGDALNPLDFICWNSLKCWNFWKPWQNDCQEAWRSAQLGLPVGDSRTGGRKMNYFRKLKNFHVISESFGRGRNYAVRLGSQSYGQSSMVISDAALVWVLSKYMKLHGKFCRSLPWHWIPRTCRKRLSQVISITWGPNFQLFHSPFHCTSFLYVAKES